MTVEASRGYLIGLIEFAILAADRLGIGAVRAQCHDIVLRSAAGGAGDLAVIIVGCVGAPVFPLHRVAKVEDWDAGDIGSRPGHVADINDFAKSAAVEPGFAMSGNPVIGLA